MKMEQPKRLSWKYVKKILFSQTPIESYLAFMITVIVWIVYKK